jgi:hypothetical protein
LLNRNEKRLMAASLTPRTLGPRAEAHHTVNSALRNLVQMPGVGRESGTIVETLLLLDVADAEERNVL